MNLKEKLVAFKKEFKGLEKKRYNEYTKSYYASLEDVVKAIMPTLEKLKFDYMQMILFDPQNKTQVLKTTVFDLEGDDILESYLDLNSMINKNTPHQIGAAITYARRYSLCTSLGIVESDDDDGNVGTLEKEKAKTKEQENEMEELILRSGSDIDKINAYIKKTWNVKDVSDLSYKQSAHLIMMLKEKVRGQKNAAKK